MTAAIMFSLSMTGSTSRHMDFDNNMPGVNGEIKKDGLETGEDKRDLGSKPKKLDEKSSKTRRTSEIAVLDAERQCLVQRPTDQQWRTATFDESYSFGFVRDHRWFFVDVFHFS